ncbi:MAG TPA: HAMP domain-containing sensor histidine kinase [Streptosporangiaceae bacterium]|nr:HAMP domain-containing sensor histidine kinase [Streptosporangiaceae bacterium]
MVTMPSWSLLPWHFIWMSLLLLYGFGFRTWTRPLLWSLLTPVLAAIALLFADPAIRGLRPYDEVVEVPFMAALFAAMVLQSGRRRAAIYAHDEVSRRNLELLERQRVFIQNASHQLRTPITVALAHAELLPSDEADPAAADDAAIVVDELTRLRGLVGQLMQLATAEQGDALRLAAVPTQLTPLLDDLVRRWKPTPRQWLIGSSDDATVLADRERLVLALDAVIENAVGFTGDGDAIQLTVHRTGQQATIVVADSGPGIPDSHLASVFERFSGSTSRAPGRNFGLGLSIVRAVAEAHGGHVRAERGPLGGAAVSLSLPLHEPTAPATPGNGQAGPVRVTRVTNLPGGGTWLNNSQGK